MCGTINSTARANFRRGAVAATVLVSAMLVGSGAAVAVPSIGSVDLGSLTSGSLGSTGSAMPEWGREEPVELPALRDDITVAKIVGVEEIAPQHIRLAVDSVALRRTVGIDVLVPVGRPANLPSLYMLEGVDAGEDISGWLSNGDAREFFSDKNVNAVMINGGVGSLYTDWDQIDPGIGLNKWETFVADELPALIDAEFRTNGVKSIAGNSMGAQGAMMIAHRNPGEYKGVAAMSGCYSTMDALGNLGVQWTSSSRNGDPANMWGEIGGPGWLAHDTVRNAEALRGMDIYLSTMSGLPGRYEDPSSDTFLERVFVGGSIELSSNLCTQVLDSKLQALKIPATVDYEPTGTHAWRYWVDQIAKAWPVLGRSLGL